MKSTTLVLRGLLLLGLVFFTMTPRLEADDPCSYQCMEECVSFGGSPEYCLSWCDSGSGGCQTGGPNQICCQELGCGCPCDTCGQ
jgi:hypothetical protein